MTGVCPHCGGPAEQSQRYPDALCFDCAGRATDLSGRAVAMYNIAMSGGFEASHRDDDSICNQVTRDGRVLVDGVEHRAGEAHMGGIVVRPFKAV